MDLEKYEKLHNDIMRRLENGEITIESARELNSMAFNKYIITDNIYKEDVNTIFNNTIKGVQTISKHINKQTIADAINRKIDDIKKRQKLEEDVDLIKKVSEEFKNENYDSMTKMKYRRVRTDYQTKRDSILCNRKRELTNIEASYNTSLNKVNAILDEEKHKKMKAQLLQKHITARQKAILKYEKILHDFKVDYRYRIQTMGLKWTYIIHDKMEIN